MISSSLIYTYDLNIFISLGTCSSERIIDINEPEGNVFVGLEKTFKFDNAFDGGSQNSIYRTSVAPLVQKFVDCENASILAYGQTGSGKTHTMMGGNEDSRGMTQRAIEVLG